MKILILTSFLRPDKADISFSMMHDFKTRGHQVEIVTKHYSGNQTEIKSYYTRSNPNAQLLKSRLLLLLHGFYRRPKVNNRYYFQDIYETVTFINAKRLLRKLSFNPDIVLVHFNMGFINAKNLFQINKITGAPIVILLMDMAPMTGGCHYAWECREYLNTCGNCPGLNSKREKDLSYRNYKFRQKYFSKTNVHIIPASAWQEIQIRQSALMKNMPMKKILSAFDPDVFKPSNKLIIRNELGLSKNKKIIFFGAYGVDEERKGIYLLLKAFEKLNNQNRDSNLFLLIAGNAKIDFLQKLPIEYHYLGFIDARTLAKAFQAADLFACSSVEDSGPTMINMSMLCGTPVVSFIMGVSPDLVIDGITGYSAELFNVDDYATKIKMIIQMPEEEYDNMSSNCRKIGLEKCNPSHQLIQYESYFNHIVNYEE